MQCDQCGATVRPGSKVCSNCGARLSADDNPRQGGRGGGNSDYEDAPYPPSRGRREEQGERNRLVSRSPSRDPMADPRAPNFLKGPGSSSRRDDRSDGRDSGSRDGGSRDGRDGGSRDGRDGGSRDGRDGGSRDGRDGGSREPRNGGGGRRGDHQDYPDYGPPSKPDRRESSYGNRYDQGDSAEYSAEMSAEYSAEMSAEYSAEYPDPRGYNQRGATNDPRAGGMERRDAGRGRQNDVQPDYYQDRRSAAGPQQAYRPQDRYDPRNGRDGYDKRDRNEPRDRWDAPDPAAEEARGRAPGRTPRGRGGGGWDTEDRDDFAPFQPQNRPGMGGDPQSGLWQSSKGSPDRKRRVTLVVAVLVILAVSAGAVGILLKNTDILSSLESGTTASDNAPPFATYTPGPTPTPPTNYQEFDSSHSLYVLDYPKSWTETTTPSGSSTYDDVDLFSGGSPAASLTVEQAAAFGAITRPAIIQAELRGAQGTGRTITQQANPIDTMMIGGEQWDRSDYLVTESGGLQFHMAILACHHRGRGYAIVLLSPSSSFSQDSQTLFEPILNSFHFQG